MAELLMWTIYHADAEHFEAYAAREWSVQSGTEPGPTETGRVIFALDIDWIRARMESWGLVSLARSPDDDPKVIETWL